MEEKPLFGGLTVYRERGAYLKRLELFEKAKLAYDEAYRFSPENVRTLIGRSQVYSDTLEPLQAYENAMLALKLEPQNMTAKATQARAMFTLCEFEKSLVMNHRGAKLRKQPSYFSDGIIQGLETMQDCIGENAGQVMMDFLPIIRSMHKNYSGDLEPLQNQHVSRIPKIEPKKQLSKEEARKSETLARVLSMKYLDERSSYDDQENQSDIDLHEIFGDTDGAPMTLPPGHYGDVAAAGTPPPPPPPPHTSDTAETSAPHPPQTVVVSNAAQPDSNKVVPEHPSDPIDTALDTVTLEILGVDPTAKTEYGPPVHKEIARRFEHIAASGLDKEARKELTDKYRIPDNCIHIGVPTLNDEIRAALPETVVKRDKFWQDKQNQLTTAISCLAGTISEQLNSQQKDHDLLKKLMDMGRILCDVQHSHSVVRRNFAIYSVKKEMKEHLTNTKIDKYLFGNNLSETLKTAKAVNKSGSDLKVAARNLSKNQPQVARPRKSTTKNWKHPAPARRPPPAPAAAGSRALSQREQPAASSRRSPPRPRTTRRQ